MQSSNHVANVCRDFEQMSKTTTGSDDGGKMGCSSHVHTSFQESIRNRVDIAVCFTHSENDLAHHLVKDFG